MVRAFASYTRTSAITARHFRETPVPDVAGQVGWQTNVSIAPALVAMSKVSSISALPPSHPPHRMEHRPAHLHVSQCLAERSRLEELAQRRVGNVLPRLKLHVAHDALLFLFGRRVQPSLAQRFQTGCVRPTEPGGRPAADGDLRRNEHVVEAGQVGNEDVPATLVRRLL